jgi:4-hydroxy-3-polyprenylbenzoate decarboxylase
MTLEEEMKRLKDLREYIAGLQEIDEVQLIDKEVDWNLEIGAIIRRSYDLRAPAPLFNRIKDSKPGFRVLGAPAGLSRQVGLSFARIALALGLDARTSGQEIIEALVAAHHRQPIPPREVASGPCKENILIGDDVDLLRLPTPLIHEHDGGRYIDTYGITVVQTPDKRWTNWSITRKMVVDKNRMTGLVVPNQHFGMIDAEWKKLGKPTPFAVAIGVEPFLPFVGGMPLAPNVDESGYVGAYFGEPVDVVRCETVDLLVPATAEIVLEGYISRTETALEGPMGEYTGYIELESHPKPVFHVTAMTYRNDPIMTVVAGGEPVEEDHTAWGLPHAVQILYELREQGLPITTCWMLMESANQIWVITVPQDWRQRTGFNSAQLIDKIGRLVFEGSKAGFGIPKIWLMEDDVDAANTNEALWAFASRCHPGIGEVLFQKEGSNNLPIFLASKEKLEYLTTKAIYNCLSHDDWTPETTPQRTSFQASYSRELQERVLQNWQAYGYRA